MTEIELIELVNGRSEMMWGLIEFWVSVSFAAIIAVHYSNNRINGPLATVVLILYTSFTLMVFASMGAHGDVQSGAYELLAVLEEKGDLSVIGEKVMDYSRDLRSQRTYAFTFLLIYLGTIGYVIFSFVSRRKEISDAT